MNLFIGPTESKENRSGSLFQIDITSVHLTCRFDCHISQRYTCSILQVIFPTGMASLIRCLPIWLQTLYMPTLCAVQIKKKAASAVILFSKSHPTPISVKKQ